MALSELKRVIYIVHLFLNNEGFNRIYHEDNIIEHKYIRSSNPLEYEDHRKFYILYFSKVSRLLHGKRKTKRKLKWNANLCLVMMIYENTYYKVLMVELEYDFLPVDGVVHLVNTLDEHLHIPGLLSLLSLK